MYALGVNTAQYYELQTYRGRNYGFPPHMNIEVLRFESLCAEICEANIKTFNCADIVPNILPFDADEFLSELKKCSKERSTVEQDDGNKTALNSHNLKPDQCHKKSKAYGSKKVQSEDVSGSILPYQNTVSPASFEHSGENCENRLSNSEKAAKTSKKRSAKKQEEESKVRTVTAETIFIGSIADIVKTRKRGAHSVNSVVDNDLLESVKTPVSQPIKIIIKPKSTSNQVSSKVKCAGNLTASKKPKEPAVSSSKSPPSRRGKEKGQKSHKEENLSIVNNEGDVKHNQKSLIIPLETSPPAHREKKQKKELCKSRKQKQPDVDFNHSALKTENFADKSFNPLSVSVDKCSQINPSAGKECRTANLASSSADDKYMHSKVEGVSHSSDDSKHVPDQLQGSKTECSQASSVQESSVSVNPPVKKKLKGIEEYKAHKARRRHESCKPIHQKESASVNGTSSVLQNSVSSAPQCPQESAVPPLEYAIFPSQSAAGIDQKWASIAAVPARCRDGFTDSAGLCNKVALDMKFTEEVASNLLKKASSELPLLKLLKKDDDSFPQSNDQQNRSVAKMSELTECKKSANAPFDFMVQEAPQTVQGKDSVTTSSKPVPLISPYASSYSPDSCNSGIFKSSPIAVELEHPFMQSSQIILDSQIEQAVLQTTNSFGSSNTSCSSAVTPVHENACVSIQASSQAVASQVPNSQGSVRSSLSPHALSYDSVTYDELRHRRKDSVPSSSSGRSRSDYEHRRLRSPSYRSSKQRRSHSRSKRNRPRFHQGRSHSRRSLAKGKRKRSRSSSQSRKNFSRSSYYYDKEYSRDAKHFRQSESPECRGEKYYRTRHHSRKRRHTSRSSSRSSHNYTTSEHSRCSRSPVQQRYHKSHRSSPSSCSSYSSGSSRNHRSRCHSSSESRNKSPSHRRERRYDSSRRRRSWWDEQQRQIEERRVVYVGLIPDEYTKADLRSRFCSFGSIEDVRIHIRPTRRNDNYGFVTFHDKQDAYRAVEFGNDPHLEPKFDISFGGRRMFCKEQYSDLDKENEVKESHDDFRPARVEVNFDTLLEEELQRVKFQKKKS